MTEFVQLAPIFVLISFCFPTTRFGHSSEAMLHFVSRLQNGAVLQLCCNRFSSLKVLYSTSGSPHLAGLSGSYSCSLVRPARSPQFLFHAMGLLHLRRAFQLHAQEEIFIYQKEAPFTVIHRTNLNDGRVSSRYRYAPPGGTLRGYGVRPGAGV